jgi:hypothetical protein
MVARMTARYRADYNDGGQFLGCNHL